MDPSSPLRCKYLQAIFIAVSYSLWCIGKLVFLVLVEKNIYERYNLKYIKGTCDLQQLVSPSYIMLPWYCEKLINYYVLIPSIWLIYMYGIKIHIMLFCVIHMIFGWNWIQDDVRTWIKKIYLYCFFAIAFIHLPHQQCAYISMVSEWI